MKTATKKQKIGNNFVTAPRKANKVKVKLPAAPVTNSLLSSLIKEDNKTLTENGAPTYKSTLNALVDFFAMGAALRSRPEQDIVNLFIKSFAEDPLLSIKLLFHIRNIRGGQGERRTCRIILKYLGDNYPEIVVQNLGNIVHYGRFDDLFVLFGTKVANQALEFIKVSLNNDVEAYNDNKPITTCAKWMPSENTSSTITRALGARIRHYLGWTPKQYRKTLSALRAYSNVVEVKMSDNHWTDINYRSVPSKASLRYKKAFMKHDETGYQKFIDAVKKGETKINAGALFPYEIVEKVMARDNDETLDILWNALPDYMEDKTRNILTVVDVSGSMMGRPMATAISLGIYTAEKNKGPFGGYFITYSDNPVLQKVVGANIREKVRCLQENPAYSTNLQSVFDMLLIQAVKGNVKQEDMPAQILVITDVEFNSPQNGKTNLETIQDKYAAAGYKMPQLVFWNVNSRQNNCAATADAKGILLVSGSSPSVFKTLLSGCQYSPLDQVLETLNNEMYNRVTI